MRILGVTNRVAFGLCLSLCILVSSHGCRREPAPAPEATEPPRHTEAPPPPARPQEPPAPPPLADPVPLWDHGSVARDIDAASARESGYLVVDLGEAWVPYLFTDGEAPDGTPLTNSYRETYLALARGEFPDDLHGERAKHDKYLELYGIAPTLSVLRERLATTAARDCVSELDLTPLESFSGLVTYSNNRDAEREASRFSAAEARTLALMRAQHVDSPDALDVSALCRADVGQLKHYTEHKPRFAAMDALQKRLRCEEILVGRGKYIPGVMDWATHESLAEFERRHRIFSQGYLGRESLKALVQPPLELDRAAVVRVLTERAVAAAGVLEDGSIGSEEGDTTSFRGRDGAQHPLPNLVEQLQRALVDAFALQTPDSTLRFLEGLGGLPADEHLRVAIPMLQLPEYYAPDMELTLDYDRGDVWYDFPFDDQGERMYQPVKHRPHVTVSTLYEGQKIPLARYGTTIGGWRTELIEGTVMWKYKDSPVGPRAWEEIVAAPVWLPPEGTPPKDLLKRNVHRKRPSDPEYVVNYHEVGPSYASAYGLVAAYHRTYLQTDAGNIRLGNDEGIRTHGSVDFMSIMRSQSHGCHRLHNHIALRLMSFVLAHRTHERVGQRTVGYRREIDYQDSRYLIDIPQTGYTFKLAKPLLVNVEQGNLLGKVKEPIAFPIPQYNAELQSYVLADGTSVRVQGDQLIPLSPLIPEPESGPAASPAPAPNDQPRTSRREPSLVPPTEPGVSTRAPRSGV